MQNVLTSHKRKYHRHPDGLTRNAECVSSVLIKFPGSTEYETFFEKDAFIFIVQKRKTAYIVTQYRNYRKLAKIVGTIVRVK